MNKKTALIGLELKKYSIDIAVLCKTYLPGSGQLYEETSGYTYFWSGLPESERRLHGVAVMKSLIARKLSSLPHAINERLITLKLPLGKTRHATIVVTYAPMMKNDAHVE